MATPTTTTTPKKNPPYEKGILYQISIKDLHPNPNQPRKYINKEELQSLADSIDTYGVLQPILFREDNEGKLFIAAGERRFQASNIVKKETIPALYVDENEDEIALVENLLRQDMTAIETAEYCAKLKDKRGYNQEQLGGIIGKAISTVSEILSLNRLPDVIRNECRSNKDISRQTLLNILKNETEKRMLSAYRKYKERMETEKKTRGPKGGMRKTWPEKFAIKYCNLNTLLTDEDLKKLDNDQRADFIFRIEELKKMADDLILQIQTAPEQEIQPEIIPASKTAKEKPQTKKAAPTAKSEVKKKEPAAAPKKESQKKMAVSDSKATTKK